MDNTFQNNSVSFYLSEIINNMNLNKKKEDNNENENDYTSNFYNYIVSINCFFKNTDQTPKNPIDLLSFMMIKLDKELNSSNIEYINKKTDSNNSLISFWFGWTKIKELTCEICEKKRNSPQETFFMFDLDYVKFIKNLEHKNPGTSTFTIKDCILYYNNINYANFFCSYCQKTHTDIMKNAKIYKYM